MSMRSRTILRKKRRRMNNVFGHCRKTERITEPGQDSFRYGTGGRLSVRGRLYCKLVPGASGRVCFP